MIFSSVQQFPFKESRLCQGQAGSDWYTNLIIVDFCKAIGLPQVYCHCEITVYPGTDTQSEVHVDLFFRCWQGQGY